MNCEGGIDCNVRVALVHPNQPGTPHDEPISARGSFDEDCSANE
ncbi:uncharacterized protein SOCEGT47_051400 [Sorangium cellulosum]|uniref:Uncharacterized protein n=1 Tax=Sorangium cellulosum TaxID=56 RepID=A0A4P2Q5U9_SORCE|nr:hypothetical protein [Sorangium cellulosum]AUX24601.1 uncharacterized protein SOCEGT47_051400 [Sorangium cellulosum]